PGLRGVLVPARPSGRLEGRRDGRVQDREAELIARLLVANALELCVGLGVVCALRVPPGAAYLAGLVVVGIVSAQLALVHVAVGWTVLAIMAGASLVVAYR